MNGFMDYNKLLILDSTLREGGQRYGQRVYTPDEALRIAQGLDRIGVHYIEAGHPVVHPRIKENIMYLTQAGLNARIAVHARAKEYDVDQALECNPGFIGIFRCVESKRLSDDKTTLDQEISNIEYLVRKIKSHNPDIHVRYTPENAVMSEDENVLAACAAAIEAGADFVSIADTNGYAVPGIFDIGNYIRDLRVTLGIATAKQDFRLEFHGHNDLGLAVANSLQAYIGGARMIDVSVLGVGERNGITDLSTLLAVMYRLGVRDFNYKEIKPLYQEFSGISGIPISADHPMIGENANIHFAGVHVDGVQKNSIHYGNGVLDAYGIPSRFALGVMSGRKTVAWKLNQLGLSVPDESIDNLVMLVKDTGAEHGNVTDEMFAGLVEKVRN